MIPRQWTPPCGNQCTHKYAALAQIPCLADCNKICYKDPVFKDRQWSAYIDRSPGAANYSEECFHACVAGCGYKFYIHSEKVSQVRPNRPPKPPVDQKPLPPPSLPGEPSATTEDVPCTSA